MKVAASDRRLTVRHNFTTPIRIRISKSAIPEQRTESVNLSERGILFPTDLPLSIGTVVEIVFKMPSESTGESTSEWHCAGHVVRVEAIDSPRGKLGVGVQFDCYQASRVIAAQWI